MNEQIEKQALLDDLKWILQCPALLLDDERLWNPHWLIPPETLKDGEPLNALINARHGKLGRYFEAMVSYLFHTSKHFDVLAENLAIRNDGVTLGELDLLVKERATGKIIHLELALKFYLWVPNTPVHEFGWIGSGLRDFLADKVARLIDHQLKLPTMALAEDCWPAHLPKPDAHYLWMPGRLYLPANETREVITQTTFSGGLSLNPEALSSVWYIEDECIKDPKTALHKSDWLNGASHLEGKPFLPAQFANGSSPPVYVLPSQWHTNALLTVNRRVYSRD